MTRPSITVPDLCARHLSLLVHGAGYRPDDPWRALVVMAQMALMQAATADPATADRIGGQVERLPELGCLGCYKPDAFGEVVETARVGGLGDIKALGESWVKSAACRGAEPTS